MEFTAEQLILIGIVAVIVGFIVSAVVQVILWIAMKAGKPIDADKAKQTVLFWVAFVASLVLAFTWAKPVFPPIPPFGGDAFGFITALLQWAVTFLAVVGGLMSQAHLIYKAVLKEIVYPKLPILRL